MITDSLGWLEEIRIYGTLTINQVARPMTARNCLLLFFMVFFDNAHAWECNYQGQLFQCSRPQKGIFTGSMGIPYYATVENVQAGDSTSSVIKTIEQFTSETIATRIDGLAATYQKCTGSDGKPLSDPSVEYGAPGGSGAHTFVRSVSVSFKYGEQVTFGPPGDCSRTVLTIGAVGQTSGGGSFGRIDKCPSGTIWSDWDYANVSNTDPDGVEYAICYMQQPLIDGKSGGPNCGDVHPSIRNPISIGTGNKWLVETDIEHSAWLTFSRVYNSDPVTSSSFIGVHWRSTYGQRLGTISGNIGVYRPDGKIYKFAISGTTYAPDADISDRLYPELTGSTVTGYRYITADGTAERYDSAGRLLSITNPQGKTQILAYDAQNRLASVTDPFGRSLRFAYGTSNRINLLTTPTGSLSYTYDTAGNLATVTYPDGKTKTYHYENSAFPNALTGITDENSNRYITYTYDGQGRAIGEVLAGNVSSNQLNFGTNTTTVTDAHGTAYIYNFQTILGVVKSTGRNQPGGAGCGPASASLAYDANGNVASRTDFNGNVTAYTYDLSRNLETKRVEASGKPEARTVSTQWHAYWRLPVKVAEPGKLTTYLYNGDTDNGQTVSCAPASATVPSLTGGTQPIGVLCRKTEQSTSDPSGSQGFSAGISGQPRTWTWTYNAYGQMLTADGPRSDVPDLSTYTYYDAIDPDLGKRGQLATVTNALGQVTRVTAYDLNGNPLTIIDPNGVTTTLTYDARQRLTSRSVGNEVTGYQYDGVGQLTRVTLPDGSRLDYTYDPAHRLTAVSDALGNQVAYTLDAMGNRTKEDVKDPQGLLARTRVRAYDSLNRLQMLTGVGAE